MFEGINQNFARPEFNFNGDEEWKPFTMKSREGIYREILVQNQFKIKQSVLLYLLSASSVQLRCLVSNVNGI